MADDFYISASDEHKKKEKKKARELRVSQWWKSLLAQGVCYYCGQKFNRDELTMDHKIPIARGGKSTKGNIVVCCKNCNTDKKHLTPAELSLRTLKNNK